MRKPSVANFNKTASERAILDAITSDELPITGITLGYKDRLYLLQRHLQKLYGEMADWNRNLGFYLASENFCMSTMYVKDVCSVIELPLEILVQALRAEKANDELLERAYGAFAEWKREKKIENLAEAAEILGVLPVLNEKSVINEYYVVFPENIEDRLKIRAKVLHDDRDALDTIVSLIIGLYDDGQRITFPYVQTVITQPRGKMFWRGENAFYGSSRPSINRVLTNESPNVINAVIKMRQDECGFFLDRFEAVRKWNCICDVNYIALMQHYGMPTHMVDITSDLKTALFFACTKWVDNGILNKWEPLTKSDIEKKDSRKSIADIGGDSRYGLIYKTRAEIEDLMWLAVNPRNGEPDHQEYLDAEKHVIPIGYQPFERTKAQHAYMILGIDDLYCDSQFDKAIFKLDEDFCRWIYEEMDRGDKIYPHVDVPDISRYVQKISKTRVFDRAIFEDYCCLVGLTHGEKKLLKQELLQSGYIISERPVEFASKEEIDKINREYSFEKALELAEVEIKDMPLMVLDKCEQELGE